MKGEIFVIICAQCTSIWATSILEPFFDMNVNINATEKQRRPNFYVRLCQRGFELDRLVCRFDGQSSLVSGIYQSCTKPCGKVNFLRLWQLEIENISYPCSYVGLLASPEAETLPALHEL